MKKKVRKALEDALNQYPDLLDDRILKIITDKMSGTFRLSADGKLTLVESQYRPRMIHDEVFGTRHTIDKIFVDDIESFDISPAWTHGSLEQWTPGTFAWAPGTLEQWQSRYNRRGDSRLTAKQVASVRYAQPLYSPECRVQPKPLPNLSAPLRRPRYGPTQPDSMLEYCRKAVDLDTYLNRYRMEP